MEAYRVAIIGTGGIARYHANYYTANPRTEIVAGADINPENLEKFCTDQNVPGRYADYEELLAKEQPDIVSVCTWQESHPRITIAAAEAGAKGIICEKPLGVDLAGPDAMIEACDARGVKLVAHHQTRYNPTYPAAKKAIADGMIGDPLYSVVSITGGLANIGSHSIDISRYLLGDPAPTWVVGQAQRRTNRYERGSVCEDLCMAIVGLDNGTRIHIDVDLPDTEIKVTRTMFGSDGRIIADGQVARVLRSGAADWEELPLEAPVDFLEDFIGSMETGSPHRCDIEHAHAAHEVMMAMYESARGRVIVELPLAERGCPLDEMAADGTQPVEGAKYDFRLETALKH
ncbi:MAG TPA: Gfo/Idh/MocA family oxidoreductase [Armatimonadota bacterium]|nr:Gfo/Idh/MocA family oxidoreductase [Armatimonadota bacterium]